MKKKVLAALLTMAMTAALLTMAMTAALLVGCGSGNDATPSDSSTTGDQTPSNGAEEPSNDAGTPSDDTQAGGNTEGQAPSGDVPTIAFVPKVMGQAWWDYVEKNVKEWGTENGIEVIYKGPTEVDAAAQVQIMTDLVNQGVDILCFSPNDPAACEAICKEAREKGIIVIATEASGMENVDYDVEAFDETGLGGFLMD